MQQRALWLFKYWYGLEIAFQRSEEIDMSSKAAKGKVGLGKVDCAGEEVSKERYR